MPATFACRCDTRRYFPAGLTWAGAAASFDTWRTSVNDRFARGILVIIAVLLAVFAAQPYLDR
ncbi:MAG: hypothetical protein ACJ8E5_10535, partial [Xanthobacteraceae bacterium]